MYTFKIQNEGNKYHHLIDVSYENDQDMNENVSWRNVFDEIKDPINGQHQEWDNLNAKLLVNANNTDFKFSMMI